MLGKYTMSNIESEIQNIVSDEIDIQTFQGKLDFSDQGLNSMQFQMLCGYLFDKVSSINVFNIDFSNNEIASTIPATGNAIAVVINRIIEFNQEKNIQLTINFKNANIGMPFIAVIANNMEKWRQYQNIDLSITLHYGDIIKNSMTQEKFNLAILFQYIKHLSYIVRDDQNGKKYMEIPVTFDGNNIYVDNTKVEVLHEGNTHVGQYAINGKCTNLKNVISNLQMQNGDYIGQMKDRIEMLSYLNLLSQGANTYIKLLKATIDPMVENVLKASMSVVQLKASINIYKDGYLNNGASEVDFLLLWQPIILNVFHRLWKGHYIDAVIPVMVPIATMATTMSVPEGYDKGNIYHAKYRLGSICVSLSFVGLAKNAYDFLYDGYQDINFENLIMVGAMTVAIIVLPTPVVVGAATVASTSVAVYEYYKDQQVVVTNEEQEQMSGVIIENL